MNPFQSSNGVIDATTLGLSLASFVLAVVVGGGIAIALKIRRTEREEAVEALKALELDILALYRQSVQFFDIARFAIWRIDYINTVEAKFGRHIWRECARIGKIPPLDAVFGELVR